MYIQLKCELNNLVRLVKIYPYMYTYSRIGPRSASKFADPKHLQMPSETKQQSGTWINGFELFDDLGELEQEGARADVASKDVGVAVDLVGLQARNKFAQLSVIQNLNTGIQLGSRGNKGSVQ